MILDERTEFADAESAILAVGSAVVGDVIDLGDTPTLRDVGAGEPIYLVIQVDTTFVGATSTTEFELLSDSTADLATSPTTHLTTGAIGVATLVAGYQIAYALPLTGEYERYLGIRQTVATANVTTGAINAFLTSDVSNIAILPDGI